MSLKISKTTSNILKIAGWIVVIILVILMGKVYFWEKQYYANKTKEPRSTAPAVITEMASAINPSEIKPSKEDVEAHQVAADEPRYLSIPRLELENAIVNGTSVNVHVLQVPDNIYEVAWYSGSSRPGTGGYIIISGLDSGASGKAGAFANLDSLESGNEIKLTTGSGEEYVYEVKTVSIVDNSDAEQELIDVQKQIDGKETLVLITNLKTDGSAKYNSIAMVQATIKK